MFAATQNMLIACVNMQNDVCCSQDKSKGTWYEMNVSYHFFFYTNTLHQQVMEFWIHELRSPVLGESMELFLCTNHGLAIIDRPGQDASPEMYFRTTFWQPLLQTLLQCFCPSAFLSLHKYESLVLMTRWCTRYKRGWYRGLMFQVPDTEFWNQVPSFIGVCYPS